MIPLFKANGFIEIARKKPGLLDSSSTLLDLRPEDVSLLLVHIGINCGESPTRFSSMHHLYCDKLLMWLDYFNINVFGIP